jgi:FixJ family two-component response regulator
MLETGCTGDRRPLAFVLDDETAVATMICKQLSMLGMEAWQFNDPVKFLVSLRVSKPKLVVLDLAEIPGKDSARQRSGRAHLA